MSGEAEQGLSVMLAQGDLLVVVGPGRGVAQGGDAERKKARFSCLFPSGRVVAED